MALLYFQLFQQSELTVGSPADTKFRYLASEAGLQMIVKDIQSPLRSTPTATHAVTVGINFTAYSTRMSSIPASRRVEVVMSAASTTIRMV